MTAENKRVSASNYQMLLSPRVNLSCCLFFPPASQKKANFASYRPIFYKIPSKFSARNTVPARVLSHSQICQPAQFSLRSGYFEDRLRWALLTQYEFLEASTVSTPHPRTESCFVLSPYFYKQLIQDGGSTNERDLPTI